MNNRFQLKKSTVLAGCLCVMAAPAFAMTQAYWTGADATDPTDLARDGNWDGGKVPELDETVTPHDGPFAWFSQSNVSQSLTMSRDLALNGLVFYGVNSSVDLDLTGRTLRLYGYTGGDGQQLLLRTYSGRTYDIRFRGGEFDVTGCYSGKHPYLDGMGTVAFSGTHFPALANFDVKNGIALYLTNGVTGHVVAQAAGTASFVPKVFISGKGTSIDCGGTAATIDKYGQLCVSDEAILSNVVVQIGLNGVRGCGLISNVTVHATSVNGSWTGVGIGLSASNSVLEVTGGAKIHMTGHAFKTQTYVGRLACDNRMTVSGAGTTVECQIARSTDLLTVGEFGDGNYFHLTDGASFATVDEYGDCTIGNIVQGYVRGDSNRNTMRVDGGATFRSEFVRVSEPCLRKSSFTAYWRRADGTVVTGADHDYSYCSNRLEVAGEGSRLQADQILIAGTANALYCDHANFNVFRAESNATVNCALGLTVGKRGSSNGVEVLSGASMTIGKYGLNVGDAACSTGTYVRVAGASTVTITHTVDSNGILALSGSGAGAENLLDVSGASTVSARSVQVTGANNSIRLENGVLTTPLAMTYPSDGAADGAVRFVIEGTNSQVSASAGTMTFASGVSFAFNLPTNGYVRTSFLASKSVSFESAPTVSFSGLEAVAEAGGGRFTLFESGTALMADPSVVAAFDAAAKASCARSRIELVDGKKLVLRVPSNFGLCIIVR